jgi:hypothetical protein
VIAVLTFLACIVTLLVASWAAWLIEDGVR